MAAPTSSGGKNRVAQISNLDLYDEDGYREWTKQMRDLAKGMTGEASFAATLLFQVLRHTPVSNPRDGMFSGGDDSKAYARKVRAHLNRAAQSFEFGAGQVVGAWSVFENGFLAPSNSKNRGMNITSGRGRGTGTRRGA